VKVFGPFATDSISVDDRAARYVDWMTLGGTQRLIPPAAVTVILSSYVLGEPRRMHVDPVFQASANMLQAAQHICGSLLPSGVHGWTFDPIRGVPLHEGTTSGTKKTVPSGRIFKNGDAELWEKICLYGNPMPVRVVKVTNLDGLGFEYEFVRGDDSVFPNIPDSYHLYRRDAYGTFDPVGDQTGTVRMGLDEFNFQPWCIRKPSDEAIRKEFEEDFWPKNAKPNTRIPYCSEKLFAEMATETGRAKQINNLSQDEIDAWARRGAMNAGLAVFMYLDGLTKKKVERVPDYNRCEELVSK
jgi:hypothetical protein